MKELFNQPLLVILTDTIICLSVFSLFLAILIDFILYSGKEKVQKEKRSIVETGTMTAFFVAFYILLQSGIGVLPVESENIKAVLMILGTSTIVAGCFANIKGRFNLGRNWANQIKIYQEQTFVQKGMYKLVRHPLYASIILMFYGACLVYRNLAAFLAVSAIFIPFMVYRARQEETLLVQRFPQYAEYKKTTGMLFPKISKRRGKD